MSRTRNYLHIVFGTKCRARTIYLDRRIRLYSYIIRTVENKKSEVVAINGMEDHVHILVNLHSTVALADLVKAVKTSSSKWIRESNLFSMFEGWASEYYACSVSPSHVDGVKAYIDGQQTHHAGKDYKEEVRDFVMKMGMELYEDEL